MSDSTSRDAPVKPCEYCGAPLPAGVDKGTRRVRSAHFEAHARERREAEWRAAEEARIEAECRPAIPPEMTTDCG